MQFETVGWEHRELLDSCFFKYGEGSCQHSFVSMLCHQSKYGDSICLRDGWLYTLRAGVKEEGFRTYLAPIGDMEDREGFRSAVEALLADAHEHGAKLRMETVTENTAHVMGECFPDKFVFTPVRDYAEYIYSCEKLATYQGGALSKKRQHVHAFIREYGERMRIEEIGDSHMDEIRHFQMDWLEERMRETQDARLEHEDQAIDFALSHFAELGLSGVMIYIDDRLACYAYSCRLSENMYDAIAEKGNRDYTDILYVLNQELVKRCCMDCEYINWEEDLGIEGLRSMKLSYRPDHLLEKYLVTEV